MENYIVSARKYRPATFQTVVGQKSLTTTLKNAILNNKLAHAYLFCGPRGVGKTTCARIFAKTINCFHPTAEGEACNECESCRTFNENRSLNIHELDAASNNSVDDIRALNEQVRIMPQLGKYKVFIIDEVHMLSAAAFNAFLKTLEEPPHHAIFILATTEKHKILPTILSRCQIYDFTRISINDITDQLEYIAKSEKVEYEPEALNVIAQKADGGMRDALSIFDQVVSFSQGHVTYKTVTENLNVLDYENYFKITEAILKNDVPTALLLLNGILARGFDGQQLLSGLALFFRDLLMCKDPQTTALFESGEAVKQKYAAAAQDCPLPFLYRAMELTNETDLSYRLSKNKRFSIELLLIRLCQLTSPDLPNEDKKKITLKPIVAQSESADNQNITPTTTTTAPQTVQPTAPPVTAATTPANQPQSKIRRSGSILNSNPIPETTNPQPASAEKQTLQQPQPEQNNPFTVEEMKAAWLDFADKSADPYLTNSMKYTIPTLKDGYVLEIEVLNPEQQNVFKSRSEEIRNHLVSALQNTNLKISISQKEKEEVERQTLYTEKEKYLYMREKNKDIGNLVREFKLRLG